VIIATDDCDALTTQERERERERRNKFGREI
jgi:hypothetical protein